VQDVPDDTQIASRLADGPALERVNARRGSVMFGAAAPPASAAGEYELDGPHAGAVEP
jgi:hypothetical protein